MSYGRLKGAANAMLMFGFGTQAAIGVSLWLVAILGRTPVRLPELTLGLSKFFNIAIFVGVIGILHGDASGFEGFELPRYAAGLLLIAFVALALPVFITFHNRTERKLYPSVWFVVAAMFWFAWVFTTGFLFLHVYPVRGILSASVHGWVVNGLTMVWLLPISVAVILYLIPKLAGAAIPSRATVLLAFWGIALIAPWGGIAAGTPLPSWVGATSNAVSAMILIPILAVYYCVAGMKVKGNDPMTRVSGRFVDFSFLCLLVLGVFVTINSFSAVSSMTRFTFANDALRLLAIYGVAGSALFAVAYQALCKLAPECANCARFAGIQFQVYRVGVAIGFLSLALAGLQQGRALANPELPFMESVTASKMMFRLSTMGDLILLVSAGLFGLYVLVTTVRSLKEDWQTCDWCHSATKEVAA